MLLEKAETRVSLGRVVATCHAHALLEAHGINPGVFLDRHVTGDWGDLEEEDARRNEESLRWDEGGPRSPSEAGRLLSSYALHSAVTGEAVGQVLVITEADRSSTTVLLPQDY